MKKTMIAVIWVTTLTILLLGVPWISGLIADLLDYQAIDPDGAYAWISVHHLVQALIFLLIIVAINRFKPLPFGFGWGNKGVGKRYVLLFTLIFGLGSLVTHVLMTLTSTLQPFAYPLTTLNITGQLGFQLFLSGPSEELIFRGFAITMLGLLIKARVWKGKVSGANLIAAVIFGLAHVNFSFAPQEVRYHLPQVLTAIILGIFYGDCYEKSGSVYYPMIMHSISNVIMVGLTIIATLMI